MSELDLSSLFLSTDTDSDSAACGVTELSHVVTLSDLWWELERVVRFPQTLELPVLFQTLQQAIAPLPLSEQLSVAGFVFDQLAGTVHERATLLLESWESWHRPTDPVLDFSHDADLFVQSQRLELADLVVPHPVVHYYPSARKSPTSPDSAYDEDGATTEQGLDLALLGLDSVALNATALDTTPLPSVGDGTPQDEAALLESIKSLSHGENIPQWSAQITEVMQSLKCNKGKTRSLSLLTLQQQLNRPLVEVWLALLLGDSGYQLTRPGGGELADFKDWAEAFYSDTSLQVLAVE